MKSSWGDAPARREREEALFLQRHIRSRKSDQAMGLLAEVFGVSLLREKSQVKIKLLIDYPIVMGARQIQAIAILRVRYRVHERDICRVSSVFGILAMERGLVWASKLSKKSSPSLGI